MSKLYVDRTVEIDASSAQVWDVLTSPKHTEVWASEFAGGGPKLHIESDWLPGSPVLWKDRKGVTAVEGTVIACLPQALLRFTVFDVHDPRPAPAVASEDGITFKLTERDGKTVLWVSQGDFSTMPDGARYRDLSEQVWERALPRIKRLAEGR